MDTVMKWEQCKQVWTPQFIQLIQQRRTWARTDAAARPCLLSPPSASLKRKLPALVKDTGPPSSAAVSSGHLPPREAFTGRDLDDLLPSIWCWATNYKSRQQVEAIWSSFSAAEGQRRGFAFKGPEAWYRLKVLWSGTDGSNDIPEAGAVHQEIT